MLSLRHALMCAYSVAVAAAPLIAAPPASPEKQDPPTGEFRVKVLDTDGKPVEKFSGYPGSAESFGPVPVPQQGSNGELTLKASLFGSGRSSGGRKESPTSLTLMIKAPDKAFKLVRLPRLEGDDNLTTEIRLLDHRNLEVTVTPPEGTELPDDLQLRLFLPEQISHALKAISSEGLKDDFLIAPSAGSDGRYKFKIPSDLEPTTVALLINHPGFLRGFLSQHITVNSESTGTEIKLPRPVGVSATFKPAEGEKFPENSTPTLSLTSYWRGPGQEYYHSYSFPAGKESGKTSEMLSLEFNDIAPTPNLSLAAMAGTVNRYPRPKGEFPFQKHLRLSLKEGESTGPVLIEYRPFDMSMYRGDYTAVITIKKANGSPLEAPTSYTLQTYSRDYGWVEPFEGVTPTSGPLVISGMKGGPGAESLNLILAGERAGKVQLKGDEKRQEITITMPPGVGDVAPEIEMVDVLTSQPMKLSDYKGQVVLVDFWATWCGPCQGPMQHNQDIMERRGADWKGKAVILGCSIDEEMKTVTDHVKNKGWTGLPQGWASSGGPGWKSQAASDYGISGVPTALLVGKDGKILKRGHPAGMEIEKLIDAELAKD